MGLIRRLREHRILGNIREVFHMRCYPHTFPRQRFNFGFPFKNCEVVICNHYKKKYNRIIPIIIAPKMNKYSTVASFLISSCVIFSCVIDITSRGS